MSDKPALPAFRCDSFADAERSFQDMHKYAMGIADERDEARRYAATLTKRLEESRDARDDERRRSDALAKALLECGTHHQMCAELRKQEPTWCACGLDAARSKFPDYERLTTVVRWFCEDVDAATAESPLAPGGQQVAPRYPLGGLQPSAKQALKRVVREMRAAMPREDPARAVHLCAGGADCPDPTLHDGPEPSGAACKCPMGCQCDHHATAETERAALAAQVGECCRGADPMCAAGCLVERALLKRKGETMDKDRHPHDEFTAEEIARLAVYAKRRASERGTDPDEEAGMLASYLVGECGVDREFARAALSEAWPEAAAKVQS